jgi:predicted nucleic acid-binding protein
MAKRDVAIVDSSALISLVNVVDELHGGATEIDEYLTNGGWSVLVPTEVFAETLNVIGKKIGRHEAVLVGRVMIDRYAAHDFDFIHAEPSTYREALALQGHGRGGPSFVDCLVMALASAYGTKYIFGFDKTFKRNGYRLPVADEAGGRAA